MTFCSRNGLKHRNISQCVPTPFMAPFATFDSEYTLEPVACCLKFAGRFSEATLLPSDFTYQLQATGVDASGYAAKLPNRHVAVIILNKDAN